MDTHHDSASRFVILAAIDGTTGTDHVAASAARLARMVEGAELHVLHVFDPAAEDVRPDRADRRRALVDAAASRAKTLGAPRVVVHLLESLPVHGILQTAADLAADLVIVGTHSRKGIERLVMGSVAEAVVRGASCPVLVVREKGYEGTPEIEPPCADCLETQRASGGTTMWCPRHAERHPRAHLHYELGQPFATGSMFVRP
jgi:nucleotide-binding universal stress UspA family protein